VSAGKVDVLKNLGTMVAIGLAGLCSNAHAADPSKGANLYSMHCANCHGPSGEPIWPGAPDFRRPGALMKPDSQLLTLLKQGRGVMPSYLGVMRDRDMYDLLAHLRTMN
jgi:mono/diheme cytochrome c family protein